MASSTDRIDRIFAFLGYAVFNFAIASALLEGLCWLAWTGYHRLRPISIQPLMSSPAYADAPWVREFFRQELERAKSPPVYVPFRLWGPTEWHGKYMNIDRGSLGNFRRNMNPSKQDCKDRDSLTVWMFGGSAVFGDGVPDWETLPSHLSQILNADGSRCVMVSNFGMEAYVSMQEVILLIELLKREGHPDMVILYDGFNDALMGVNAQDPRTAHYGLEKIRNRVEGSARGRFDFLAKSYSVRTTRAILGFFHRGFPQATTDLTARAGATVDNYEENLAVVRALSRMHNFKFYCFLQPMLGYGHKPLVPYERQLADFAAKTPFISGTTAVYEEAVRRSAASPMFVNLANVFDTIPAPLYIDEVHVGPQGNELAARTIANYIAEHPNGMAGGISKDGDR